MVFWFISCEFFFSFLCSPFGSHILLRFFVHSKLNTISFCPHGPLLVLWRALVDSHLHMASKANACSLLASWVHTCLTGKLKNVCLIDMLNTYPSSLSKLIKYSPYWQTKKNILFVGKLNTYSPSLRSLIKYSSYWWNENIYSSYWRVEWILNLLANYMHSYLLMMCFSKFTEFLPSHGEVYEFSYNHDEF